MIRYYFRKQTSPIIDKNFEFVKISVANGLLPKVYRIPTWYLDMVIITDYELMKEAFTSPAVSNRFENYNASYGTYMAREDYGLHSYARKILGDTNSLIKNKMNLTKIAPIGEGIVEAIKLLVATCYISGKIVVKF